MEQEFSWNISAPDIATCIAKRKEEGWSIQTMGQRTDIEAVTFWVLWRRYA